MESAARAKRKSKVEIYIHYVWATKNRAPSIDPEIERPVHRCIASEAKSLGCDVIALNGMEDHVHLLVRSPSKIAPAQVAKQVKGVSSTLVDDEYPQHAGFYWQEGYGAFSVSRWDLDRIADYVRRQKHHHAMGTTIPEWEETDEPWP